MQRGARGAEWETQMLDRNKHSWPLLKCKDLVEVAGSSCSPMLVLSAPTSSPETVSQRKRKEEKANFSESEPKRYPSPGVIMGAFGLQ